MFIDLKRSASITCAKGEEAQMSQTEALQKEAEKAVIPAGVHMKAAREALRPGNFHRGEASRRSFKEKLYAAVWSYGASQVDVC